MRGADVMPSAAHGKRSGYYSDYTFGVLARRGESWCPIGKAYFGFTDVGTAADRQICAQENTIERFGPVRSVRAGPDRGLVFEVAFEAINRSTRQQIRCRHALSPRDQPPALGQAARREGRTGWRNARAHDRTVLNDRLAQCCPPLTYCGKGGDETWEPPRMSNGLDTLISSGRHLPGRHPCSSCWSRPS